MRIVTLSTWAAAALSTPAFAGTPDGLTPAEETVCDDYEGRAFGLCNAYCEAMDCDDPAANAAPEACASVAGNFSRLTGEAVLPCDTPPETCTIDAVDDYVEMLEPGTYDFNVLDNDAVTPADADLYVESFTSAPDVTPIDAYAGDFAVSWVDDGNAFVDRFDYTACCAPGICDTATVTILGS